jgi:hypothetical protein
MKISQVLALVLAVSGMIAGIAYSGVQDGTKESAKQESAKQESQQEDSKTEASKNDTASLEGFEPVDNMHHFMEYICEPSYKSLKQIMQKEPEDRKGWKAFKNHTLVLAETSALVATRGPDEPEKSKKWKEISLSVYKSGAAMYKATGNFEEAKKHYSVLIDNCNQCHTVFAEGKHQLKK